MTAVALVVVGLFAGALSATLGIGGGVVFVPALAVIAAFDQQLAQGTSLAVIVPTTLVGALVHARAGRVDWALAARLALGGIAGGLVGAQVALGIDEGVLRRMFAGFLAVVALRMLLRAGRAQGGGSGSGT